MSDVKYLMIDGHSVLFSWKELRALHQRRPRAARDQLIHATEVLHDSGRWRVTLVFDGKTRGKEERRPDQMLIVYAAENETADSLIERTVGAYPHPEKIYVVTNDNAEAQTVIALGAHTESAEWLQQEIESCENQIQNLIHKTKSQGCTNKIQIE